MILILPGCDGPKKSNTPTSPTKVEAHEGDAVAPIADDQEVKDAGVAADDNEKTLARQQKLTEMVSGTSMLESLLSKLTEKLALSDKQSSAIKNIVDVGFSGAGYSLDKEYSFEESLKIKHNILQNSSVKITELLDAKQKEKFEKFMSR